MQVNQISQLLQLMGTGGTQSTTGVLGSDSSGDPSSSFETLLNQMVSNSQNQTINITGTSVPITDSKDNTVNGLDSLSIQSQKAQQLQQMLMQQMMQSITTQGSSTSSSIGESSSDDSADSLFPSTNSASDLSQLMQAILQKQTNTSAKASSLDNLGKASVVASKSNI